MPEQKLSRRDFLRNSAIAAFVVGGLAACAPAVQPAPGGEQGAAAPAGEAVTLTFVCDIINEGHVKVRDKWAQEFSEQNPGVTVQHQPTANADYNTKIQTLFAAGTPPDIYRYLQEITPIITVSQKALHLQLDDYIAADDYDLSDFRPDAIKLYQWDGKTFALPRDYGNQNLFYNVDIFEEAGVEPPPVDWEDTSFTFEVFLDMLQRLVKREGDRVTQWGFLVNRGQRPWASWVYSNGGALVHKDDSGVATDSAMADEATVEALQFLQDLMYKHEVSPRPDLESELGGVELFSTGRVAVMLTNPSAVNQFRPIEAFRWDVGTIPIGKAARRGTGGGGTGWASGAGTKHPQEAWGFLKHITSAQAELDEVSVGATTPSRVSVVTSEAFLDPNLPPKNAKGFAQAQEFVVRDPVHVNWPEITQRIYSPNMDLLWSGTEDAATVAARIKQESDPLFAQS
ncbi:MAG: sugar ABC transporter substrate-binding protein [Caldilinea sp.]|nr:sugar ABC transporter substrate-binding protein [Caldilinea sp.]MCB9114781.1 sugar ABC transporter substrate-binding protein [Caldilineaceae bacterium]MCB0039159.1 sugar ABC transporter substrate-binding protein [Caldilinea sp.]MCB0052195.1 sugar ABC transporter substrate-binding protein [Caldilinea sp.]MCB9120357.1 sugar ABC transporter substrate-binding protein [Caldilineaceae bacterium]